MEPMAEYTMFVLLVANLIASVAILLCVGWTRKGESCHRCQHLPEKPDDGFEIAWMRITPMGGDDA